MDMANKDLGETDSEDGEAYLRLAFVNSSFVSRKFPAEMPARNCCIRSKIIKESQESSLLDMGRTIQLLPKSLK